MQVAVVGLGDIAQKAYLPVYAETPGLDLHLVTRDEEKLRAVGERYGIRQGTTVLEDLSGADLDAAFVHAATEAHHDVVGWLLEHGLHVYVDKPAAPTAAATRGLVELAEREGRILMVGFNRRFAPRYRALRNLEGRELVVMRKDRPDLAAPPRSVVFDDFIHVVDTLRWLAPEATRVDTTAMVREGELRHLVMRLAGHGTTALGIMNRASGRTDEVLEVSAPSGTHVVHDLLETLSHRRDEREFVRAGHWERAIDRMGFTGIVGHFLAAVAGDVDPWPTARDALATHELCERVVTEIED